jgi:intraflagellar transport protein 56
MNLAKPKKNLNKGAAGKNGTDKSKTKGLPTLEDFLGVRDFTGALTLLEFKLKCQDGDTKDLLLWIGYCAFHLGNFRRAEDAYKELLDTHDCHPEVNLFLACCYFYQQMYEEADKEVKKGPEGNLKNRILFNIAHRLG